MSNGRKFANIIVDNNVKVSVVDSDLANTVSVLKSRLDSDDTKLQSISNTLDTNINLFKSRLDSDDNKLQSLDTAIQAGIQNLADSDLIINQLQTKINSVISNVDSDSPLLQSLNTQIEVIKTRLDSDEIALQAVSILTASAISSAGLTDSDLKVVADIRNHIDSEIIYVKSITLSYTNYIYTATAGQTTFTGNDDNSVSLAYTAGAINVFMNGVKLLDTDFTATNGTSIVLTEAVGLDTQIVIVVPKLESNYVDPNAPYIMSTASQTAGPLKVSNTGASDRLGMMGNLDMARGGLYFIVGADLEDTGNANAGSAYIYFYNGSSWSEQARIQHSDDASNDRFGIAVAINSDGTTAVVGAWNKSGGGAAYIFTRSGTSWSQQAKLTASDTSSYFGTSVAIMDDGSRVAIGDYNNTTPRAVGAGAAYIFTRSGSSWSQQQKVYADDGNAGDHFSGYDDGRALSLSGDGLYLVVGAYSSDNGHTNNGAAYQYAWTGSAYGGQRIVRYTDFSSLPNYSNGFAFFGWSVDVSGDGLTMIVGAKGAQGSSSGLAMIYVRSDIYWSYQATLSGSDISSSTLAEFGHVVSLTTDGNSAMVGAKSKDGTTQGAVYFFSRSGTSWTQAKKISASNAANLAFYGSGADISGNGSVAVVAAGNDDTTADNSGAVYTIGFTQ